MLLLTKKSSKSIICFPKIVKSLQIVIPKIQGRDKIKIAIPFIKTAFFRLQFHKSCAKEIIFWNTACLLYTSIPEYVVVHDGTPSNPTAKDYYVRYRDYIKNVASSEIYATWPDNTCLLYTSFLRAFASI